MNLILYHGAEGMAKKNLCIQPMYMYACMFVRVIVRVCVPCLGTKFSSRTNALHCLAIIIKLI